MNLPPPPPSEHGKELPLSGYKQKRLQAEQQKKRLQQQWKDQALALAVMGVPILLFAGCVKLVGSNSNTSGVMAEFGPFTEAQARLFCKDEMKRKLRDPGSLRIEDVRITSQDGHLGTAAIDYQAKNGFGGMNRSTAICEKYENPAAGDRVYIKVSL